MRAVAREKAATGGFEIDASHWFKTMTDKINLMKKVEDRLSDGLVAQATARRQQAWTALFVFACLGVGAVTAALIMAYALVRSITTSVNSVLHTMRGLAEGEGDLTRRLAVVGTDEIGRALARVQHVHAASCTSSSSRCGTRRISSRRRPTGSRRPRWTAARAPRSRRRRLEQTAASLEEITGTVKRTADNARQADQLAGGVARRRREGRRTWSRGRRRDERDRRRVEEDRRHHRRRSTRSRSRRTCWR